MAIALQSDCCIYYYFYVPQTKIGSKGKRSAATLDTTATIGSAEKHARRCQKWGTDTCLYTLAAHDIHNTYSSSDNKCSTFAKLPALDALLQQAGVSSIDKDSELLLQLQQTLDCATTTASNSNAPHIDTVVQLRDELLQGFTDVQHSTDTKNTISMQYR
jgi:hypothetical protein